jgi:hypothetical protein
MEAGLTKKSGNAEGVKASTGTARKRTNIHPTQRGGAAGMARDLLRIREKARKNPQERFTSLYPYL